MIDTPRRTVSSLVLAAALLVPASSGARAAEVSLKKDVLADGVFLFRAPTELDLWTASNSVVVVGDEDVTVFDSNTRAKTARMVIAEIRKLTDKPVRTLINSHWHMDHWTGNGEYAKAFPGLRIIATAETREYMSRMGPRFFADEVGLERSRTALDTAIRTGKRSDGTPLTAEARRRLEADLAETAAFAAELEATPRVLPNLVYRDTLTFWSGKRELRLISATGDATGSTILYLPAERVLVMGDVLVSPETGEGPPSWTTNSYAIAAWLKSLRAAEALEAFVVVPGQGGAFRDKEYLRLTIELFASITEQVDAALRRGLVTLSEVQAAVNVDAIGRKYRRDGTLTPDFPGLVKMIAKKVHQEALDGAASAR